MALAAGTRVGPYEIIEPLAAGGMGQVYRARDPRLNRAIAVKVIADALLDRPGLRERFKVEARAIATLNHPNICQVYDVGEHDAHEFIVMELVEGETLAARLQRGRLPAAQALKIARELSAALAAAHRLGIVHRDIKPANVMLTPGGAKLLDFGLARLRERDTPLIAAASTIPPATPPLTSAGAAMGTWQYMAPEQVRGEAVDSRSDVFALGAVIYEIMTGRRAFGGATHADLVTAILESDPPSMRTVDQTIPAALDQIVAVCLSKIPDDRWHSAGEVRRALDTVDIAPPASREPGSTSSGQRRSWTAALLVLGGAAAAASLVFLAGWRPAGEPIAAAVVRSAIPIGGSTIIGPDEEVIFSRDGRSLIFAASTPGTPPRLFRHDLGSGSTEPINGTEGGGMPFLSPDGHWLGFKGLTHLMKVPIGGGRPTAITPVSLGQGASWGADGRIVYGDEPESGLMRVSAEGGTPEQITTIAPADRGNDHRYPTVLPGGKGLLFAVGTGPEDSAYIAALDYRTGAITKLIQGSISFRYVATGHLAFARDGVLFVQPFDINRLALTGAPVEIAAHVDDWDGAPRFDFSPTGDLIYAATRDRGPQRRLALVDLRGNVQMLPGLSPGPVSYPRFSPDGTRIAFQTFGAKNNVWVYDLKRETVTRVTYGRYHQPVWTPDGRLTLSSGGPGHTHLVIRAADGTGGDEPLTEGDTNDAPRSWSPDGRTLAFDRFRGRGLSDVFLLSLPSRHVTPLLDASYSEHNPRISPDGRWLAYASTEDGSVGQIYIRPLAGAGQRVQVSAATANFGVWSRNGRQFYFRGPGPNNSPLAMWVVDVETAPALTVSAPRQLFVNTGFSNSFDLSPDGTRFVMSDVDSRPPQRQFELVQNWFRHPATTR